MSDPERWRMNSGIAPRGAGELLAHLRRPIPITAEQKMRSGARVARLAGLSTAAGMWLWVKGAAWGAGLGLSVVVGIKAVPHLSRLSPKPSSQATTHLPATTVRRALAAPTQSPTPDLPVLEPVTSATPLSALPLAVSKAVLPVATVAAEPPASAPTPPDPETLAREAESLAQVHSLMASDPKAALAEIEAHAAAFPRGKLTMERELLAVEALRRAGLRQEARGRCEALLNVARGSLYEQRIRGVLESLR